MLTEDLEILKLKKTGLVKECPDCKFPYIKSAGCNHMECKCGCHWCYKCGAGKIFIKNI